MDTPGTRAWVQSPVKARLQSALSVPYGILRRYIDITFIPVALRFAAFLYLVFSSIYLFVDCIRHKWGRWPQLILSVAVLACFASIVVMMPESRASYFYAVLFAMYAVSAELMMSSK